LIDIFGYEGSYRAWDLLTGSIEMSSFLNQYGFYFVNEIQQNTMDQGKRERQRQLLALLGVCWSKVDQQQAQLIEDLQRNISSTLGEQRNNSVVIRMDLVETIKETIKHDILMTLWCCTQEQKN
ncbi:hypothetical protein MKW98_020334, partial [Papaver atlanticum]